MADYGLSTARIARAILREENQPPVLVVHFCKTEKNCQSRPRNFA